MLLLLWKVQSNSKAANDRNCSPWDSSCPRIIPAVQHNARVDSFDLWLSSLYAEGLWAADWHPGLWLWKEVSQLQEATVPRSQRGCGVGEAGVPWNPSAASSEQRHRAQRIRCLVLLSRETPLKHKVSADRLHQDHSNYKEMEMERLIGNWFSYILCLFLLLEGTFRWTLDSAYLPFSHILWFPRSQVTWVCFNGHTSHLSAKTEKPTIPKHPGELVHCASSSKAVCMRKSLLLHPPNAQI